MDSNTKIVLKSQMYALQAKISACQGLLAAARGMGGMVITPTGPGQAPALNQMVLVLDAQIQFDTDLLAYLGKVIDAA